MITRNLVKYVHSLSVKKYRDAECCFVADGPKVVTDLLPLMTCKTLFATPDYLSGVTSELLENVEDVQEVTQAELERLSQMQSPRGALAVFRTQTEERNLQELAALPEATLCLALDSVQNPGNLGTIIRVADWFGISHIFASPGTADVYAPKVVQATMGAIGRIRVHYLGLPAFLKSLRPDCPVYGTFLNGRDLYRQELCSRGLIVMGNEGKGISPDVEPYVTQRLLIPAYPPGRSTVESLNVALATAIVCAEFRRRSE